MLLDATDREILAILQSEARISNRVLARRVAISESACRERVRRLERAGIILGYRAVLCPSVNGGCFELWASISLSDVTMAVVYDLDALLHRSKEVVAIYTLTGAYDHLIHFRSGDVSRWEVFCIDLHAIGIGRERIKFGIITAGRMSV